MIEFALPPTGDDNPPAFLNPTTCHDWLATVPAANPGQAQAMFLRQLNLLHRYTLPAADRFALLETLRTTLGDVQDDMAKKFAGKPLPFTPTEQAALDGTVAVWQAFLNGYLRCLQAVLREKSPDASLGATLAQRALAVFADWQVDLCRGEQLPDSAFWGLLHRTFSAAEHLKVTTLPVDDATRHGSRQTSALGAYGEVHLVYMASPFEVPQRHLNWIARWARRWGDKLVMLSALPAAGSLQSKPLYVDLGSSAPPSYQPRPGDATRCIDMTELRRSLKTRLTMLEKGEQPSRLQLGEDCTQPAAGQLLQRVYQRWCKGGAPRRQERKPASGGCEFIAGYDAAHYYLSGRKPFRQPVLDESTLREERDKFATFGHNNRPQEDHFSTDHGYAVENWAIIDDWQLLDQSASGLRLSRPLKAGVRVGTGQLIAVKLAGSSQHVVGNVRWALHEADRDGNPTLGVGIQLFPGVAAPIALRGADPGLREFYRPGFLLPAVTALNEPESIVLPVGTFRINRPIEVFREGVTQKLKLAKVLDRGGEFERCSFTSG